MLDDSEGLSSSSVGNIIQCHIQIYNSLFNYKIHKLFLCAQYINIKTTFMFSILAGLSVC